MRRRTVTPVQGEPNHRVDHGAYAVRAVPGLVGLTGTCLALGYLTPSNPVVAGILLALFLCAVAYALAGVDIVATIALVGLPWLVLLSELTPKLTLTLSSAVTVLLLLAATAPWHHGRGGIRLGTSLFAASLLAASLRTSAGAQLIEAAKDALFPAMALIVCSTGGREWLMRRRSPLLFSGVAAMSAQAIAIVLHLGQAGTYYGAGEQLGLVREAPHELALIGVLVAVACLLSVRDLRWRVVSASIAAAPALATGVRSALIALALCALALIIQTRLKPSIVLGLVAIVAMTMLTGVGAIVVKRFEQDQAKGEYANLANAGSGRTTIWRVALDDWSARGIPVIAFGSGLRSIEQIIEQYRGTPNSGQSDLVTVLVDLGLVGFVSWLLIWFAIVRSGVSWLVLLPLASYALTNGALEYVGAVVYGLALAGSCAGVVVTRDKTLSEFTTRFRAARHLGNRGGRTYAATDR
jgi:O-antigen ligase